MEPTTFRLWNDRAPYATGDEELDTPSLTFHTPATPTGSCVLVCPGGGYQGLAKHEGEVIGKYFADVGIAGAVLKYRLAPRYKHPAMLTDVSRAMRLLRHRAGELRIDPHRIAVMGFSAGGHLASTLSTHFDAGNADAPDPVDRESSRPDASVLCYPVITFAGAAAHAGSRRNLIGENPPQELVEELSNERKVTKQTPPTFIFHTADDPVVTIDNALLYAAALAANKVPFELHAYETGSHGVGLALDKPRLASWGPLMVRWLQAHGW